MSFGGCVFGIFNVLVVFWLTKYDVSGFLLLTSFYGKKYFLGKEIDLKSNYEVQKMLKTICLIGLIFSFLPGVSLLGHLSGFIAGCFLFLI